MGSGLSNVLITLETWGGEVTSVARKSISARCCEVMLWVALVHLLWGAGWARRARDVVTTQGPARGYFAPQPPHYAYLGLPYAVIPARFKAPVPPPRWDGLFEATHKIKCSQRGIGTENCLVINVFTPANASRLPVVVIVHDGNFQNGWGPHETPTRFLSQNLVVVTFNYRLGALGFLCLGIPDAPGNAGLKDQIAALYWVRRNIVRFGGNPGLVTLYGLGAGAASAQMLLLSGLTVDLVHKVVLESGNIMSPMSITYDPISTALSVANSLDYADEGDLKTLSKFFQNIPARKLSNITEIFLPCIESDFGSALLTEDPVKKIKDGSFQKVPMILIYSGKEAEAIVGKNNENFEFLPDKFEILLPNNVKFPDMTTRSRMAKLTKEFYFDKEYNDLQQNYIEYINDVLYEFPTIKFAILYAEFSYVPVYVMKFAYKSEKYDGYDENPERVIDYISNDFGIGHDVLVVHKLMMLLKNFITLGDPTPITTSLLPTIWQPVSSNTVEHVTIKTASILLFDVKETMFKTKNNQRLKFWDHIYNNFYRVHTPVNGFQYLH